MILAAVLVDICICCVLEPERMKCNKGGRVDDLMISHASFEKFENKKLDAKKSKIKISIFEKFCKFFVIILLI